MRCLATVLLACLGGTIAHGSDWDAVRQILGRDGDIDQGVLRVTFERSDLHVTLAGIPVSPDLVLDSWYGFWPQPDGSVMMMGDTCVKDDEVAGVLTEMHRQGLDLSALHNHLVGETPRAYFLHLSGHGTAAELARKVKAVLARTATPTGKPVKAEVEQSLDWSPITRVLGQPADKEGNIVEFGYRRRESLSMHGQPLPSTDALETAPEVKFQMLPDGRAISYGEMILTQAEVKPVFHTLLENGLTVTALHNHMTDEEPRLFFLHWWSVGDPARLARAVKAATAVMNIEPERK